jgi:hypothetical protein
MIILFAAGRARSAREGGSGIPEHTSGVQPQTACVLRDPAPTLQPGPAGPGASGR